MNTLYDWVFNFNPYKNIWNAVKREDYKDLFNESASDNVLSSSNIETLTSLIEKTDGDKDKIQELLNKGK